MIEPTLKQAQHLRVRPLSVNDRRALQMPVVKPKTLHQIVHRPVVGRVKILSPLSNLPAVKLPPGQQQPQKVNSFISKYKGVGVGRILAIIGNGPTHKMADLPRLKGLPLVDTMSINKPDERIWPTTYWLFCDNSQLQRHRNLWDHYHGPIFNTPSVKQQKSNSVRLSSLASTGYSFDLIKGVYIGRSSVYTALQVASWMNYDQVYVFGCDMCAVGGKLYPWGHNPDVADNVRERRFEAEAASYKWAADNLTDEQRKPFIFCSSYNPWPFLSKFQVMTHIDAVEAIVSAKIEHGQDPRTEGD